VRISPGDKIQHSYDRQIKGLNRTANNAFKDINTVDVAALTEVEQTIAFAVDATAKMTQLMATENTQDKLRAEIKNVGDKITDVKTAFAKLMSHNL